MREETRHLPFSAIVGQDLFKTVYLANIVDPLIGGLLVAGAKGTGKSTMVHAVAGLLPEYEAIAACPFHCDPGRPDRLCSLCRELPTRPSERMRMKILTLPLSCTEDRLIGSLDIEALLRERRRQVQPGILGEANRNLLYVDEVNLLPDHLVDDILDAAASHWSRIEREGVSVSHSAEFVLVGTMNPEEGELRPQILDRFPLSVKIETIRDPEQRAEIVRRNLEFERDPDAFHARFAGEEERLRTRLREARQRLPRIPLGDDVLFGIASACTTLKVDGQRPDIVIAKTARAVAALDGREQISQDDVLLAAHATLGHRTRDGGLLEAPAADEIAGAFRSQLSRARKDAASPKRAPAASGATLPPAPSPAPQPIGPEAPAPGATPKKG